VNRERESSAAGEQPVAGNWCNRYNSHGGVPLTCQTPKNGSDNLARRTTSAKPFQLFDRLRSSPAGCLACQSRRPIRSIAGHECVPLSLSLSLSLFLGARSEHASKQRE